MTVQFQHEYFHQIGFQSCAHVHRFYLLSADAEKKLVTITPYQKVNNLKIQLSAFAKPKV
jgi:hypothetical protein